MQQCKECPRDLGATHWTSSKVIKTETGAYFQGPKRTWLLEAPGLKVYMIDDKLICSDCPEGAPSVE